MTSCLKKKKKNLNVVIIVISILLAQFETEFTSVFLRQTKRLCCDTNEDEYAVHEAIGIVGKRQNLPFNLTFLRTHIFVSEHLEK